MPCQYYLPGEAEAIHSKKLQEDLDKLTHENDVLRELVLAHVPTDSLPRNLRSRIKRDQTKHRKQDLERLTDTLTDLIEKASTSDEELHLWADLGKVKMADPKLPLQPQLGFDPDRY